MAQYFENANLPSNITEFEAYFLSNKFVFKSDNGVFSKEKLDFGTRLLLESLPMQEMKGDVLDLGCGYGVVSIILSRFIEKAKKVSKLVIKNEKGKTGKIRKEKSKILEILKSSMKMIKAVLI